MSDSPRGAPAPAVGRGARTLAAVICGLEALVLAGVAVFYVYELVTGSSQDALLVVGSAAVVVLLAAGIGAVARGWLRWTRWPRTPTVVWHLLLLPVAASLLQAGEAALGGGVLVVAVLALGAAFAAPRPADDDPDAGDGPAAA